jgi:hypothetical protein
LERKDTLVRQMGDFLLQLICPEEVREQPIRVSSSPIQSKLRKVEA